MAGGTSSTNFPTTIGDYDTTHNGGTYDAFISLLDMGVAFYPLPRGSVSAMTMGTMGSVLPGGRVRRPT